MNKPLTFKKFSKLKVGQCESLIYKTYYTLYPNSDGRWTVWPDVLDALRKQNKKKALFKVYREYSR